MSSLMVAILGLIVCAAASFHLATRCNRRARILAKIPGAYAYPFVGNLLEFNVSCLHEFWKVARRLSNTYYPITRFWLCKTAVISVRHPQDIQILLSNPKFIDKGYIYDYLHPWLKTGLLTSTGSKWRHRRKILTPAFHYNILREYYEIVRKESKKIARSLSAEGAESIKDVVAFCSRSTLRIICESAMAVSLDSLDKQTVNEYERAVHQMGKVVLYRMPRPYLSNWMVELNWHIGGLQRKALKVLDKFTSDVIEDRKSFHERTGGRCLRQESKKLAMLDLLLLAETKGSIDFPGIKEEVDTFTFEAHDTTAMAMAYTLMLLAENPEAQQLARSEVTRVFGKPADESTSLQELTQLEYLECCIKESLRLFPPVATLMRYTADELQLKHALVPKDSHLMIHLYDTHRDPNFWLRPDNFEPERFLAANARHPFCYLPFSAGPRNCIGQKFAMMELKLLIGQILREYRVEAIDRLQDMKLVADIVLRPLNAVRLKFIHLN